MNTGESQINFGVVDIPDENEHRSSRRKSLKMTKFTAKTLEERYVFKKLEADNPLKSTANYVIKYYKPSRSCMKNYFFARFPFFDWIRSYSIRENLLKDLIAGLTVSKTQNVK